MSGPTHGESFVEMAARPDAWGEIERQVADVIEKATDDRWLVEVGQPAIRHVPPVFVEHYGPSFGRASVSSAWVARTPSGRLVQVSETHDEILGSHCLSCGVASVEGLNAVCANARCDECGELYGLRSYDCVTHAALVVQP